MNTKKNSCGTFTTAKDNQRLARILTRLGLLALLFSATWLSASFCFNVYFDRFKVYNESVQCAADTLIRNGATFWLRNGTLLGATRMGRLIIWDSKLHFGIARTPNISSILNQLSEACFPKSFYNDGNSLTQWHMCNSNLCAIFDEAEFSENNVETSSGVSPIQELIPLKECSLMDVQVFCPFNSTFYLESSFGRNWLTTSFLELFGDNNVLYDAA